MAADGAADRGRGADPGCITNPIVRPAASYDGEPCEHDDGAWAILQGRAQKRCPLNNRHVFSATYSNTEGNPVPAAFTVGKAFFTTVARDPRTYTIKTAGYDLVRQGTALLPLQQSDLQSIPAGVTRSLKSQLQLAITMWDDTDRFPIIIDWGQDVEVLAERISLHVVGPGDLYFVPPDNDRRSPIVTSRTGVVLDSVLNASIWATESPRGDEHTRANMTSVVAVTANTQPLVQVPTNAISVTGFQSSIGAASAAWDMVSSATQVVGTIPWVGRKTFDDEIPLTNVSHLRPEIDPVNDRIFTLRWKIQL